MRSLERRGAPYFMFPRGTYGGVLYCKVAYLGQLAIWIIQILFFPS